MTPIGGQQGPSVDGGGGDALVAIEQSRVSGKPLELEIPELSAGWS